MTKEVTIVVYKPSTQNTEEYMVVVDPDEYKKYKDGDTSVALALIVDSFDVFHSSTGHTGHWGKASNQQLQGTFESTKPEDAVKQILDKGVSKSGQGFGSKIGDPNLSRGGKDARTSR
ncbi:shwachman-bodian-diamond syndrome protein [Rhizoctonia solani AG-3 Rhs1AP]|uniref:Shwachman-bodian-diamond syndrome protein n=2 Tax=Rhizoctonia solani AG-3 TaxID=1086053 RepID=A0A074SBU1_9AGAM|nr:shwachman-bodian-diamond syndrome protein [Rhizoctonia solani AG-3 Rhs1AP]KEP54328.1 shwachman-bodian-diamond syndrome protein [Rhizoctonia solani 123E]